MPKQWKKQTFSVFLFVCIINIVGLTFIVYKGFQLNNNINRVKKSAIAAPNPDVMQRLCQKLKKNLEKHGMTDGHAALFHKSTTNDVGLYYRSIRSLIKRLNAVKKYHAGSTRYNTALLDIRLSLRKMPSITGSWIWSRWAWWILLICLATWVGFVITYFKYEAH